MNWQHCHQMICLGLSDSWEQYYQGIRRCWRYGQKHDVDVLIVASDAEGDVVDNVRRKEEESQATAQEVIACMSEWERAEIVGRGTVMENYPTAEESGENWKMMLGDSSGTPARSSDGQRRTLVALAAICAVIHLLRVESRLWITLRITRHFSSTTAIS